MVRIYLTKFNPYSASCVHLITQAIFGPTDSFTVLISPSSMFSTSLSVSFFRWKYNATTFRLEPKRIHLSSNMATEGKENSFSVTEDQTLGVLLTELTVYALGCTV